MLRMLIVRDYTSKSEKFSNNGHNLKKIVFFVWNKHGIRAEGMSRYLSACLYFLYTSINCALVALLYRYLFARKLKPKILVDAHRGAFQEPWSQIKFLTRFVIRRVELVIVENTEVQNLVSSIYCVQPLILEDPIPIFDQSVYNRESIRKKWHDDKDNDKALNIVVINPFTWDSPLQEILEAASELRDEAKFYITGDFSKARSKLLVRSDNVILTGFLSRIEYESLLKYVDVIIDLTLDTGRMQAGAYEAVAAGKALIVSDSAPLRRYFNKGTIHVVNSTGKIIEAIRKAREKKVQLEKEMHELCSEKQKEWEEKFTNSVIHKISSSKI